MPKFAFRLGRFDVITVLRASQKLVVDIYKTLLKISSSGVSPQVQKCEARFPTESILVIILGIHGVALHEVQKLFFLCRGKRHFWNRIVVDNLIDLEVKGVVAEAVVLYRHVKNGFQGTLAVADGVIGNALFLNTQGPFLGVGQLHAVNAGSTTE